MGEENNAKGSGAPDDSTQGGAGGESHGSEGSNKKGPVDYDLYSRAVEREKRAKQEAREAQEKLDAIERDRKAKEQEQLESEGQWQKLAESRAEEIQSLTEKVSLWETKYNGLDSQVKDSKKAHAVASKLPGSLRPDYYHMLDLDSVVMNPESGEIDEASAVKAAETFHARYPELVTPLDTPRIPNGEPSGTGTKVYTPEEYKKLSLDEKRKALNERTVKFSHGLG